MTKAPSSINRLRAELRDIRAAKNRILGGFQSATTSGGSATDSYTNLPLPVLEQMETDRLRRINALKTKGRPFQVIQTRQY